MATAITIAITLTAAAITGVSIGSVALAHDEIESSSPAQGDQFDESISEVYVDFGQPVNNIELVLVGPDDRDLPGEVIVLSESEAMLEFEPLTVEGEYVVRYLADEDGHLVIAAFSFTYGDPAATGAGWLTWALFGALAAVILGVGAFFSFRRTQTTDADADAPVTV